MYNRKFTQFQSDWILTDYFCTGNPNKTRMQTSLNITGTSSSIKFASHYATKSRPQLHQVAYRHSIDKYNLSVVLYAYPAHIAITATVLLYFNNLKY